MSAPLSDDVDMLAGLDDEQRAAAEVLRGPVRILAGAGTGKTRAITHRIAHGVHTGVYQPTEVLAVTFTTKAAGEMRERLRLLGAAGVQARTFHSAALRQLRYFWPAVYSRDVPAITESKLGLVASAASRLRLRADQTLLRDVASEIEWAKVSNVTPEHYARRAQAAGREVNTLDPDEVGRLFAGYEEAKRAQGRMDMEDVLLLCAAMLADDERTAAAIRRQYKFFTVDEFQDVSPIQAQLLDLWLGGRDDVCVVGDPAQTIYSFAGASADYLRRFDRRHPDAVTVELVRNYRSTPEVIALANDLLAGTPSQGVTLRAQAPSGPPVRVRSHDDEPAEAEWIAGEIARRHRAGTPWREQAVLVRINAQTEAVEDALVEAGVPYVVRGAARFFERREVRQAITLLRGTARSGTGADDPLDDVRGTLGGLGWSETPPTGRGEARGRWESWQALLGLAQDFFEAAPADGPPATLGDLVDDLDRRAAEQHAPTAEGVTLATLHAAKGLEWDQVFLAGLQDGTLPISFAQTPAEIEEERRLLYVGVTRARRELSLSWAAARNPGGRATRSASRFIEAMATATDPRPAARESRRKRRGAAVCRQCGAALLTGPQRKLGRCADCPADYDEALYERLREWRLERSSADKVPAYVVFTDATLELIAQRRPADEPALLSVSGVGRGKLEKYGADVLRLVRAGAAPDDAAGADI